MTGSSLDLLLRQFINGNVLFIGLVAAVAACFAALLTRRRVWAVLTNIVMVLGAACVAASAVPLPLWTYGAWVALLCLFVAANDGIKPARRWRAHAFAALAGGSFLLAAMEIPFRLPPADHLPAQGTLCVIGDSLCIGADRQEDNWPERLAAMAGLEALNHSFGGAKAKTALHNAKRIPEGTEVVIVEVSGNDLLNATAMPDYEAALSALLDAVALRDPGRVYLLETPLPPFHNRYGRVQRAQARARGITLIPRGVLARVLTTPGSTLDGLHLSDEGHARLAEALWSALKPREQGRK